MPDEAKHFYFDPFHLDWEGRLLLRRGRPIHLREKVLETLYLLIINRQRVVSRDELQDAIWPDSFVEENGLNVIMSKLRDALGGEDRKRYIKTMSRRGYRFIAEVRESGEPSVSFVPPEPNTSSKASQPEGVSYLVSPYPGPQEFPTVLADKFFGRNKERGELLDLINKHRLVLVDGPSGVGKSSLLNTAIRQGLEEKFDVLKVARVGGALPNIDKYTEIGNIFTFAVAYSLDLPPNPMFSLDDCLRSIRRKPGAKGRILILDQFEELFMQHPERHEDRAGFFKDLIGALKGDKSLHVILAIRKEYLADVELLAESVPDGPPMQRFKLKPMERPNIVEAITLPIAEYANFAEGVVDEVVNQLDIIKVPGPDGVPVERHGEFIEMVHLQIVCQRLWRRLPEGITRIEREHLRQAAGEGKTFKEFVVNALDEFYNDVVEKVANSSETRENGGSSEELIRFGCMQFVTPASTRIMVRRTPQGRTGRLPDWIVKQLEKYYLLRCEERGGERWYELAHDRLVQPVIRQRDGRVDSLLYAIDLLEKMLSKALDENGGNLKEYFVEHRDMLRACQPFRRQVDLFPEEAEFIFRASLVDSLRRALVWSRRLGKDHPGLRLKVLREALKSEQPVVRHHAAELLGKDPVDELLPELARLAIEDDSSVRRAAAESLARLDAKQHDDEIMGKLFAGVFHELHNPASQSKAEAALAHIRIAAAWRGKAPIFDTHFRNINILRRFKIRGRAFAQQLWDGLPILLCIVIPAGAFAAIAAAVFKLLPGFFGWALTQTEANAGPGFFQGFIAGMIWAGLIVLGLTEYYIVSEREYESNCPGGRRRVQ
jgi:DNA-binding winged helix-turn-helix (wHTH) protein